MKQSLDLKLGQHLTITPQLQQAIRLLQLSTLELQQEVQQALESNPLLEEAEEELAPDEARESVGDGDAGETDSDAGETSEEDEIAVAADAEVDHGVSDDDSRAEEEWNESAADYTAPTTRTSGEDLPDIDTRNSAPTTLRDHLLWQMQMMVFSDTDRRIAIALIDAIDDDGYLDASLEDVQQAVGGELPVDLDEIEAVLHQIQNFDPAGVGARSLAECLLLQLRQLPDNDPVRTHAKLIATPENLDLLAARDFKSLKRATRLSTEDLQAAIHLIQHLNPRPGAGIQSGHAAYVVPDITVRKLRGVWRAELNSHVTPRVRINQEYERLIRRGSDSADNRYLQEKLQEARWFLKSLTSRNDTLLKVSRAIVDRQRGFFEHGPEAMRPLVLHDIAEIVGMHESTISRVTTNKYMLTPRGIFELKYFFSSHVSTADGGTCSATAIRSLIRKLIEAEKTDKPISDSMIAEILDKQGIHVARRTVAKYRESLNIPPSSQRKSLT